VLIGRRNFLLSTAALAAAPAARAASVLTPGAPQIRFNVVREGSVIGTHALTFYPAEDGMDVQVDVEIVVRFGPIAFFRYTLNGIEQWRGGQVQHVAMQANDDGTPHFCAVERDADGLWVTGSRAPRYLAPPKALPATHWNEAELSGPWINPQDGKLLHPQVADRGRDMVELGTGSTVSAERFDLSGEVQLQIWYSRAIGWTALNFTAQDGSLVRYERA
jgi:hypothetical protein